MLALATPGRRKVDGRVVGGVAAQAGVVRCRACLSACVCVCVCVCVYVSFRHRVRISVELQGRCERLVLQEAYMRSAMQSPRLNSVFVEKRYICEKRPLASNRIAFSLGYTISPN